MLPRDDPPHVRRRVQAAIVVVRSRLAVQRAGAADEQARRAVELGDDRGGARLLRPADVTGEQVVPGGQLVRPGRADDDRARRNGEYRAAALGGHRMQDIGAGQPLQQLPGQPGAVAGRDAEDPLGPARVPGLRAADGVEQRILALGGRADPRERGRGAAPRERGHALPARPSAPDEVAVPVVPDEALEPFVFDSALRAHAFDNAADPRHEPAVRQVVQVIVEGVRDVGGIEHLAGHPGESRRLTGVDLDDGTAGLLQGAADARLQAELQNRVEQQPTADPRPHPGRDVAGPVTLPERRELVPLDEVGRDDPVPPRTGRRPPPRWPGRRGRRARPAGRPPRAAAARAA